MSRKKSISKARLHQLHSSAETEARRAVNKVLGKDEEGSTFGRVIVSDCRLHSYLPYINVNKVTALPHEKEAKLTAADFQEALRSAQFNVEGAVRTLASIQGDFNAWLDRKQEMDDISSIFAAKLKLPVFFKRTKRISETRLTVLDIPTTQHFQQRSRQNIVKWAVEAKTAIGLAIQGGRQAVAVEVSMDTISYLHIYLICKATKEELLDRVEALAGQISRWEENLKPENVKKKKIQSGCSQSAYIARTKAALNRDVDARQKSLKLIKRLCSRGRVVQGGAL